MEGELYMDPLVSLPPPLLAHTPLYLKVTLLVYVPLKFGSPEFEHFPDLL